MKLDEFKKIVDAAVEYAGPAAEFADVEVWFKKTSYEIRGVSQFHVKPDVMIEIGPKTYIED